MEILQTTRRPSLMRERNGGTIVYQTPRFLTFGNQSASPFLCENFFY
jgi:hypothetical protein